MDSPHNNSHLRLWKPGMYLLGTLAAALVGHSSCADETSNAQLPKIIQSLLDWEHSFSSMRVVVNTLDRQDMMALDDTFPPEAALDGRSWGLRTTLWCDASFRLRFSHENLLRGHVDSRQVGAVDEFTFWIGYSSGGKPGDDLSAPFSHLEVLPLHPLASPVLYTSRSHPLRDYCRIPAMKGVWFDEGCCWVGRWLSENQTVRVAGREKIEGHDCILIEAQHHETRLTTEEVTERWWLDPEVQFLPRQYLRINPPVAVDGQMLSLPVSWKALTFRRLRDDLWFPETGTYSRDFVRGRSGRLLTQTFEWSVVEAAPDRKIPATLLLPPEPTADTMMYANDFEPSRSIHHPNIWSAAADTSSRRGPVRWYQDPSIVILLSVLLLGGSLIGLKRLLRFTFT